MPTFAGFIDDGNGNDRIGEITPTPSGNGMKISAGSMRFGAGSMRIGAAE